nr:hypothetical protein HK105_003762 [Polyrhizophydium stewartii]
MQLDGAVSSYAPLKAKCFSPTLLETPSSELPPFYRAGVPYLDHFMCMATFHDATQDPVNLLVTRTTVGPAVAFFMISAIESTRTGASLFVHWNAIVGLAVQVLGVGVAAPGLWVPTYAVTRPRYAGVLRPSLVWVVALLSGVTLVSMVAMPEMPGDMGLFTVSCFVFNLAPVVLPFVWAAAGLVLRLTLGPLVATSKAVRAGSRAAASVYETLAVAAGLYWVYGLVMFVGPLGVLPIGADWRVDPVAPLVDTGRLQAAVGLVRAFATAPQGPQAAGHFLLFDLVGVWAAMVLWAAFEDGLWAAAQMVVVSGLAGPGAAVLRYAGQRERRIGGLDERRGKAE